MLKLSYVLPDRLMSDL